VDRCADGSPAYHDCAAVFLDGRGFLVDPTWRAFGIAHEAFAVLDDVQAISHQAMQPGPKADPRRLRLGLKLNPEDRWTQLQFVRGMARAGEVAAAEEELRKVRSGGAGTWDVHLAAAELEIAREHWRPALAELQQALALNPSNALMHFRLSGVYGALRDEGPAETHMRRAMELDRGEFAQKLRHETELGLRVMDAFSQAQSRQPSTLEALQRQAEVGDLPAQMAMAKACFEAKPPRTQEGMRWNLMAAKQGNDQAQYQYARNLLVLRGKGAVPEALSWLTKSAEQGNDDAQFRLGLILYEGKLVPRGNVTAAQWVYLAADQKHDEARRLLKEMQLFLSAADLAEARKRADDFQPVQRAGSMPEK